MEIRFKDRNIIEINDARIIFRNFEGRADKFNHEGNRNFAVVIPNQELADKLINDVNEYGVGWNVKVREARDEDEDDFRYLSVKVKFNNRGPAVYLETAGRLNKLDEESVGLLDNIDIASVDMDLRPYDDIINGKPFRTAYLQAIRVTQNIDRFAARYAEEESPEE